MEAEAAREHERVRAEQAPETNKRAAATEPTDGEVNKEVLTSVNGSLDSMEAFIIAMDAGEGSAKAQADYDACVEREKAATRVPKSAGAWALHVASEQMKAHIVSLRTAARPRTR